MMKCQIYILKKNRHVPIFGIKLKWNKQRMSNDQFLTNKKKKKTPEKFIKNK